MNRRDFLKGLAALTAVAISPAAVEAFARKYEASGYIHDEVFYLKEPLVLRMPDGFIIERCKFVAMPGFQGAELVRVASGDNGVIQYCVFDVTNMPAGGGRAFLLQ